MPGIAQRSCAPCDSSGIKKTAKTTKQKKATTAAKNPGAKKPAAVKPTTAKKPAAIKKSGAGAVKPKPNVQSEKTSCNGCISKTTNIFIVNRRGSSPSSSESSMSSRSSNNSDSDSSDYNTADECCSRSGGCYRR